jgi:hypothetical protein
MFAHWYKRSSADSTSDTGRGVFHFTHIGLGLIVVMMGWATSLTGTSKDHTYGPMRLIFRIHSAMGGRVWSRAGSICHWMEDITGGLYRGELASLLFWGVLIEELFAIAYVFALVGLSTHRRQRDIVQTTSPGSSEKALTGTRGQE